MTRFTRRRFLGTSAAAPFALSPVGVAHSEEPIADGWIDSHVHVWTNDPARYPVSNRFRDREPDPETYLPSELLTAQEGTGVTRTVLVQMSFYEFDNRYMLDAMKEHPGRFSGIGIVDSESEMLTSEMSDLAEQGVRGFRLYAFPDKTAEWANSIGMASMWKTGGEKGLAMCCLTDPRALPDIRRMCERFPDTTVVIDHFARVGMNGTIEENDLAGLLALADFPQVHVKVSAYYALGKKLPPYTDLLPMIRRVRDAYGSERLMWGSDAPYQVQNKHSYKASLALITEHCDFLDATEKENILKNTAERLFF